MARAPDGTVFERAGPAGAPVVVLCHGLGLCRAVWQWQVPVLAQRFDVITYDLFGHGDSAPPPDTPSLTLFSEQLAGLLDHCGVDHAAIVGFSLGGMIARRFAQDHPARTDALAILHSPHRRTAAAQRAILDRVEQARDAGPQATVAAALDRWFTEDYRAAHPQMMDLVRAWVLANDIAIYHTIYRVLADGVDEITAPVPPIDVPTLVVTGDEDYGNGPEMTHAIAAEIAGAQAVILPGLRHMALAEDPQAMNDVLVPFLDNALAGAAT